ncbi:hypothetical protein ILYODFUR_004961 [Ilyodon furcidens]|uniref:Uncharacterized protein n=1 Tax=Ilyodon furcidens TaxID=33524 RepID=A0ABV0URD8_9TELE
MLWPSQSWRRLSIYPADSLHKKTEHQNITAGSSQSAVSKHNHGKFAGRKKYDRKSNILRRKVLEHLMLASSDKLIEHADFAHTDKSNNTCFNDHSIIVLDWPANWPDLNSIEKLPTMQMS